MDPTMRRNTATIHLDDLPQDTTSHLLRHTAQTTPTTMEATRSPEATAATTATATTTTTATTPMVTTTTPILP